MDKKFSIELAITMTIVFLICGGIHWYLAMRDACRKKAHILDLFNMEIGAASQEDRVDELVCYAQQFKCVCKVYEFWGWVQWYKTPIGEIEIRFCGDDEEDGDCTHLVQYENQYVWHPYYSGSYEGTGFTF